jgi:hypothetical protein
MQLAPPWPPMLRFLDTLWERMSDDQKEQHPGDRPPTAAHYKELNVFGSPTGAVAHVREGDRLPGAPRNFTWRRVLQEGVSGDAFDTGGAHPYELICP